MSKVSDDLAIVNVREPPECQNIHILAHEFYGTVGHQRLNSTRMSTAITPGVLAFLRIVVNHRIDFEMRRESAGTADCGNG